MKRLIIAGGTGFLGKALIKHFQNKYDEIVVLSRSQKQSSENVKYVVWDAKNEGSWKQHLEGAETIINLCGKSVDCRYTPKNKALIFSSRLEPTALLGTVIRQCKNPPKVWINAASATIYRASEDKVMTEADGEYGEGFSVEVCKAWEKVFNEAHTPETRKINLRISMVMGREGGVFPVIKKLTKRLMGGKMGSGNQLVSWIHEKDFCHLAEWVIQHEQDTGPYIAAAPHPIKNKDMMTLFRKAFKAPFGLPAPKWILEIGAVLIRTETELVLKSRNVISDRAMKEGFKFEFERMEDCITDLSK